MTDIFTEAKRSEIMSKIRSKDTKPEKEFQEQHPEAIPHPKLPYSPDFLLDGVPVFLDSDFWHGQISEKKFRNLAEYWRNKLFRNMIKDICADAFWDATGLPYERIPT